MMNNPEKCNHAEFNEYFEKCDDCGTKLEDMPKELQDAWHAQFEDEGDEK